MSLTLFASAGARASCLLSGALVLAAPSARAAEPLVWKFKAGDVHRYEMVQDMTMTVNMGAAKQETKIKQNIDMTWEINSVADDGTAVLTQKIDRMRMSITNPGQPAAEFDSKSDKPMPQPMGAIMEPMFKALTSASFKVTMTPRGEVTDVEVPEALVKALQNSPGAQLMGELTTKEGFKNLVQRGSLALPAELKDGTTWTSKVEMDNPATGKQTVETTYLYKGPRDDKGTTLEVFEPKMSMSFGDGGKAGKINIAKQDSSGEILFNRNAGRLERSMLKQDMEMQVAENAQQAKLLLSQTVELKWVPAAAAEKTDAGAKAEATK